MKRTMEDVMVCHVYNPRTKCTQIGMTRDVLTGILSTGDHINVLASPREVFRGTSSVSDMRRWYKLT